MLGHDKMTAPGHEYEKNVFGPAAAEKSIEMCRNLIDLAKIHKNGDGSMMHFSDASGKQLIEREVKICYDEWNV